MHDDHNAKPIKITGRVILSSTLAVMLLISSIFGVQMYANAQNSTQSGNSTDAENEPASNGDSSTAAQNESVTDSVDAESTQVLKDVGKGSEELVPADNSITRSVTFPTMLFEDDVVSEGILTMTWKTDGTTEVRDDRGYSYTMKIPSEQGIFSLFQNSDTVVQRVVGEGLQYDIIWQPAENSNGEVDRFKFTIVGRSDSGSKINLEIQSDGKIDQNRGGTVDGLSEDSFLVTKSEAAGEVKDTKADASSTVEGALIAVNDEELALEGIGLDWSDAVGSGYDMKFNESSSTMSVEVGEEFSIDPVTITTTTSNLSAGSSSYYENEKRVVRIGSVLFAFYIGSGPNIAYRYSTDDGNTWSSSGVSVGTGSISTDVNRWTIVSTEHNGTDSVVVLYHTASGSVMSFKARYGTVNGTSISWSNASPFPLFNVTGDSGTESAGVDTNGNIYVGLRWQPSVGPWTYSIMKSTDGGSSFSTSLSAMNHSSSFRTAMALTNLADGKMLYVFAKQDKSELFYQVYNGSAWSAITNTTGAGVSTGVFKHISAASNRTNSAYVAFVSGGNSGNLKIAKWNSTGGFKGFETADATLSHSLPSISITSNSTGSKLRVYSIASSKVYETIKDASWRTPTNPFGTSFTSLDQLTSPFKDVGAIWREQSSSPFNVKFGRDVANINWEPSTVNLKATVFMPLEFNFTSDISIASATLNASSGVSDFLVDQNVTIPDIKGGELQPVIVPTTILANVSAGWYNGTISLRSNGASLSSAPRLNMLMPDTYSESFELDDDTHLVRMASPSYSNFLNNTYDVLTYITFPNDTKIIGDIFYDLFIREESAQVPLPLEPLLDSCTTYSIKYDQDYRDQLSQANLDSDIETAKQALNTDSHHPLIIRTDIPWIDVDHGSFNDAGEWVPNYDSLDSVITGIFDELIITDDEDNIDNKAYVVLATSRPPQLIANKFNNTIFLNDMPGWVSRNNYQVFAQYTPEFRDAANDFINQTVSRIIDLGYANRVAYWQIDNEPSHHPVRVYEPDGVTVGVNKYTTDWESTTAALVEWLHTVRTLDPLTPTILNVNQASPEHYFPNLLVDADLLYVIEPFTLLMNITTGDLGRQLAGNMTVMGFDIYPDQWVNLFPSPHSGDVLHGFQGAMLQAEIQYANAKNLYGFTGKWAIAEMPAGPKAAAGGIWYITDEVTAADVSGMIELSIDNDFFIDDPPSIISLFQLRAANSVDDEWSWSFPFHHAYGLITGSSPSGSVNTSYLTAINSTAVQDCGDFYGQDFEVRGDSVYVVWSKGFFGENKTVEFRKSTDGADTFDTPEIISTSGNALAPQIAVSGNNVYVVWYSLDEEEVFFSRSTDGGDSFSIPVNLSDDADSSLYPEIIASENEVYVMWEGDNLYFTRSINDGATFSAPTNLDDNIGAIEYTQMGKEGNNLYLVWRGYNGSLTDPYFIRSANNGSSFSATINLSPQSDTSDALWLDLASAGDDVYVVWSEIPEDEEANEVYLSKSTNDGATFGAPANMSMSFDIESQYARVEARGEHVYLVWHDLDGYAVTLQYSNSTNHGATWSDAIELFEGGSDSTGLADVIATGNYLYIAWQGDGQDTTHVSEIYFLQSDDNGTTLSPVSNLSETRNAHSIWPVMYVDDGMLYLTYVDKYGNDYGFMPISDLRFRAAVD